MTDHLLIATAADCTKGYYESLKEQVVAAGVDFIYQPINPFSWRKLIQWELAVARTYPKALIAFCDTWDMLYFGSRKEFESVVGAQPLLFHAEKRCWPDPSKFIEYPFCSTPWRYVNGTGPAGTGEAIAEAIEYGMENYPIIGDEDDLHTTPPPDNDQRFYTDLYLDGFGKLDITCKLSQSLVDTVTGEFAVKDGRLVNKVTGTRPLFVHANGATTMLGQKGLMDVLSSYRPERPW